MIILHCFCWWRSYLCDNRTKSCRELLLWDGELKMGERGNWHCFVDLELTDLLIYHANFSSCQWTGHHFDITQSFNQIFLKNTYCWTYVGSRMIRNRFFSLIVGLFSDIYLAGNISSKLLTNLAFGLFIRQIYRFMLDWESFSWTITSLSVDVNSVITCYIIQ